jgi:hypothetical protein
MKPREGEGRVGSLDELIRLDTGSSLSTQRAVFRAVIHS